MCHSNDKNKHRQNTETGNRTTLDNFLTWPNTCKSFVSKALPSADVGVEEEEDVDIPDSPQKPEGYSVPKPKITYKPYTLKEYSSMKQVK